MDQRIQLVQRLAGLDALPPVGRGHTDGGNGVGGGNLLCRSKTQLHDVLQSRDAVAVVVQRIALQLVNGLFRPLEVLGQQGGVVVLFHIHRRGVGRGNELTEIRRSEHRLGGTDKIAVLPQGEQPFVGVVRLGHIGERSGYGHRQRNIKGLRQLPHHLAAGIAEPIHHTLQLCPGRIRGGAVQIDQKHAAVFLLHAVGGVGLVEHGVKGMVHHIVHPPEILQQQPPVTVAEHIGFVILQPDMDQTVACPAVTEGLAVQDRLEPLPQIFHHLRVRVIRQQTPQQTLHAHGVELLVLLCKAAAQQLKLIARVQSV